MKTLALVALLLITNNLKAQESSWPAKEVIEAIKRTIDNGYWQGAALAWIDGDKEGFIGFGQEAGNGSPKVSAASVFEIGSISKVFTTALLCDALAKNEIKLEATLGEILGTEKKLSPSVARITIEQLATHSSGLPRMPTNFSPENNENPYVDYGQDKLFAFLATFEVNEKNVGQIAYSNLGMGLLGTVLGIVLKKDWPTLIKERITAPLKMNMTGVTAQKNEVQGHSGKVPTAAWDFDALAGAGDLVSSAHDMILWGRACLSPSKPGIHQAIAAASKIRKKIDKDMSIGLGWHTKDQGGRQVIWHNGGTGGFSSFFAFEPKSNRAIFLVASSNGPEVTNVGFHAFFSDFPMGITKLPKPVSLAVEDMKPCVGRYSLKGGLMFEIALRENFLTVAIPGQSTFTLYPSAKNEFFLAVAAARCHFIQDKEGKITALVWSQGGQNQRAIRVEGEVKEFQISPEDLEKYTGRFRLTKDLIFTLKVVQGRLKAGLTGQPSFPIYAKSKTEFYYRILDAQMTFFFDDKGKVTALELHQNGADKKAPRID